VTPLVSVIVPTFNSRETLRCALESIQRQDVREIEVWVIGDACSDGSEAVVEALQDDRFHWLNRAANSGSSCAGYREGSQRASARYVAYLGHDDLWFPWHLSSLLERMASDRVEFVHSLVAILTPAWVQIAGPPDMPGSYRGHFVPPSGWLHERSLVERAGGWTDADRLPRAVDSDLMQRMVAIGARISCSERLSVLKWPSAFWRAYADDAPRPQIGFAAAMTADPQALAVRVLSDFAVQMSRRTWRDRARGIGAEWREASGRFRDAMWLTARQAVNPNGNPRWPFASLLRWRYQRIRRRMRSERGLTEPQSSK
jgi:glycosyltransferase involved in cell wall biosynthesis